MFDSFLVYPAFAIFLFWLVKGLDFIVGTLRDIPLLKKIASSEANSQGPHSEPKVSIIVAARNEEKEIHDAVRSMLNQNYPDFEVIAVNDRSTDNTLSLLQSLQTSTSADRFRLINLNALPEGWLGKTHALYQGYLISSGQWILFTDADVSFDPATLLSAVRAVQTLNLDHLALFPRLKTSGYLEALFTSAFIFAFCLWFRPWAARQTRSQAYAGIGSFNMLKREVYEKIGTHKTLALEVADDMMLGKHVKMNGFRQMMMSGKELISERWVEGFAGVIKSLEKNAFAGLDYNFSLLLTATAGLLVFDFMPYFLIFQSPPAAACFFGGVIGIIFLMHLSIARFYPLSVAAFPAHPLGSLLLLFIIWRSSLSVLKNGGVQWRDTFYPLESLRKGKHFF